MQTTPPSMGKLIIITGIIVVIVGLIVHFSDRIPSIGRLPGDIAIRRENFSFYFPLGTSILVSLIVSIILYLIRRFS